MQGGHRGQAGEGEASPTWAVPTGLCERTGGRHKTLPRSLASCKKPGENGPWFIPQEGLPPLEVQRSRKKEPGGGAAHPFPGLWADKGFLLLTRPRACVPSARNAEPPQSGKAALTMPGPVTPATGRGRRA